MARVLLVLLLTIHPAVASIFPDRFARGELILDEWLEHSDLISSAMYITFAYTRAFQTPKINTQLCDDGFHLIPIPSVECPVLNTTTKSCQNATKGELCVGSCDSTAQDVMNCIDAESRRSISIYRRLNN